jgi:hypothetical protein
MRVNNDRGAISLLVIPIVLLALLFIGAVAFGFWAFQSRQDYKNNSDQKVQAAVVIAKQQESTSKDKEFTEKEKSPLRTYTGPSAYGSVSIQYPKTWSAYIADDSGSDPYVDGYFYPGVVPNITNDKAAFAVRVQVVQQSYSETLNQFQSQVESGTVKVSAYKSAKVPNVVGSRIDGQIEADKNGVMILLPLRDKTLKLWTNASQFQPDFETYVLPNFSFAP